MSKTLVIAEKPSVGGDLARVLPGVFAKHEGYLESDDRIVSWAVGHLVTLADPEDYDPKWKRWSMRTLPILPERFALKPDETGKRQLVLIHQQATQGCGMDQAFYVLAEDGQTPLARFFQQFTLAVAVCARQEWSELLWEYGRTQHLIEPCDARGIDAWRVESDEDAWAEVVRQGVGAHAMQ